MSHTDVQVSATLKLFRYYKDLAERAISQVEDDALFWQPGEESNSIAILVGHLAGNMRSRWTDFLTSDGEKEWRQRDLEFEPVIKTREELERSWNAGWQAVFDAIEPLRDDQLSDIVYIRNQGHTVREAIQRQIAHYAYHVGQIVYICKLMAKGNWQSLSISKGKSQSFNADLFARQPHRGHFTDKPDES